MKDDEKFRLVVSSREGILFQGKVSSITSYNEKGKFDILAEHANFISLVSKGVEIREVKDSQFKTIAFDNALLRVKENYVEVYVGIEGMSPISM